MQPLLILKSSVDMAFYVFTIQITILFLEFFITCLPLFRCFFQFLAFLCPSASSGVLDIFSRLVCCWCCRTGSTAFTFKKSDKVIWPCMKRNQSAL